MSRILDVLALAVVIGGLSLLLHGCGATPAQQHASLDAVTDVADPTYRLAVEGCDAARDAIVARQGTTYEQDRAAMDQINTTCDGIVLGFESLRSSQLTARQAIDSGAQGTVATAIAEALRLWAQLKVLVRDIRTLGQDGGV